MRKRLGSDKNPRNLCVAAEAVIGMAGMFRITRFAILAGVLTETPEVVDHLEVVLDAAV